MLVGVLVVLNIPVYLFLAWVIFGDREEGAASSFLDSILNLLKTLATPWWVRMMQGDDGGGFFAIFPMLAWVIASGAIVFGEYWLITKYIFTGEVEP